MIMKVRKRIAIAIQARLASTRFPEKSIKPISETGMSAITSLIHNCMICADHVESKRDPNTQVSVDIWVLVPNNEIDFWKEYLAAKRVNVHGGSPTNVLSRYTDLLADRYDYIMRLTSDCPNVPQLAMNKAIWTAIYHDLDYCSNVWEDYRTAIDGHDIELMSFKALQWLSENAELDNQKEHVTLAIRQLGPKCLKKGCLVHKEDLSHIKLCIDTEEEYKRACERFGSAYRKRKRAMEAGLYVYEY
jgi:spore coat polysaccharide biosynthesis protein SpsF (cytidylyltransferase family)